MVAETRKTGRALLARGPDLWACATLVLVALLAAVALWGPGMVNTRGGGDSPFLLQRTHQMVANLRAGVFPVRWMPDGAYGLGYPFFSFYAALPYYLAGLLALTGLDLLTALKLVQTLGFVAAALGMYGWMYRMARSFPNSTLSSSTPLSSGHWMGLEIRNPLFAICHLPSAIYSSRLPPWPSRASSSPITCPRSSFSRLFSYIW
jgi:hypothetical protein